MGIDYGPKRRVWDVALSRYVETNPIDAKEGLASGVFLESDPGDAFFESDPDDELTTNSDEGDTDGSGPQTEK
jgi:hypothetical protein